MYKAVHICLTTISDTASRVDALPILPVRFNYAEEIVSSRGATSPELIRAALARLVLTLLEDLGPLDSGHCLATVACGGGNGDGGCQEEATEFERFESQGIEAELREIFGVNVTRLVQELL